MSVVKQQRNRKRRTQNCAAEAFGNGSVPASALRVNMKRYSSAEGGWYDRKTWI